METSLSAIVYTRSPPTLKILNQLLLPHRTLYENVKSVKQGYEQIKQMKVRGAPAIAIVAALSLAIDLQLCYICVNNNRGGDNNNKEELKSIYEKAIKTLESPQSLLNYIKESLDYLKTSRPTAVNLFNTANILLDLSENLVAKAKGNNNNDNVLSIIEGVVDEAESMLKRDVEDNKNIGRFGAEFILNNCAGGDGDSKLVNVITHCNTGSLATAGYGTALGVIRSLHSKSLLSQVYFTETRPYSQGARLTSYELLHEQIPSTLICDSMVSALLSDHHSNSKKRKINAIIVGADRVARNGDTANKIGTYQLAISAKYHGVMFIVAAPSTSIDLSIKSGKDIIIEERSENEVLYVSGIVEIDGNDNDNDNGDNLEIKKVRVPPKGVKVWNPSFDVTPAELITAIVTEVGVMVKKDGVKEFDLVEGLKKS
ncbi:3270_t:CDS:2 [Entrophospora sp. SA101]|nr:1124_t:CDS:2 [Entrophospora sp. SA101]CAJ0757057.1 20120_t:CDS:2 [Entrophospora sp. SA101]CAJ0768488.1 3270_t:CDS:2 [Entrophospora sp. SA101]CAJ0841207.1 1889_t:CDS:2 [Entrophospora sp. SA101]